MKKFRSIAPLFLIIAMITLAFSQPARAQTIVCLETTAAPICMELLDTEAPVTAQNFLSYVQRGTYRNSFLHQLVNDGTNTYLQGGKYVVTGLVGLNGIQQVFTSPPASNESSISNTRGTVTLVPDDPGNPDSGTSQFLINIADNPELDTLNGGYSVFARIIGDGMAAVDAIASLDRISLASQDGDLDNIPVLSREVPAQNSLGITILEAYVYDGDISDFETDTGDGTDDGTGDGGTGDGTDGNTDDGNGTPVPGEGETLYEDAVCVDTNQGEFCMELLTDAAPITVSNFLNYVNSGRYDDTIVHRSVPNFVIQAGGYASNPLGEQIPRDAAIQNEYNRSNQRGTVAMARLGGQVNSATSEWFVNVVNNGQLDNVDGGFTVFAEIISGMSVVDAINGLPRVDLRGALGNAFGELPRVRPVSAGGVVPDDLVLINRVYVTDLIVGDDDMNNGGGSGGGGDNGPDTTASYSTNLGGFLLPVRINDTLYRVAMIRDREASDIVFNVNTGNIILLNDTGQDAATMDLDAGTLLIPSVTVNGIVITDVLFNLTELSTLTFQLESFNRE